MNRLRTLLIGDFEGAEFASIEESLNATCQATYAPNIAVAISQLVAGNLAVDAFVLAWPYPGAFSAWEIHRLRKAAPLARQLAVLGSWCEGEGRNGELVPGLIRTVWHQWSARWAAEFQSRAFQRLPTWCLPETTGDEERLLVRTTQQWPLRNGLIAIFSRDAEMAELYAAVCQRRGFSTFWLPSHEYLLRVGPTQAVIWDGDARRLDELEAIRANTSAKIVALIDFPRADDVRRATEAGATAVLGRPMAWDCLFWHIDQKDQSQTFPQRVA